nr:MAG TPA: hypothetical protein [Caudoviricetes sp.]
MKTLNSYLSNLLKMLKCLSFVERFLLTILKYII